MMKLKYAFAGAILFLVFSNLASAQSILSGCSGKTSLAQTLAPWYCSDINQAVIADWSAWAPVVFAAISFAFLLGTAMLMVGIALKNDRIRNFATGELYEAVASTLIAGLFVGIAAIMFGIIPSLATGAYNPYYTSLTYISQVISILHTTEKALWNIIVIDAYYSHVQLEICTPTCLPPIGKLFNGAIFFGFFWPAFTDSTFMLDAFFSYYVQYYMILFFMYAAMPAFLIPGILFRTFLPTRAFGGMMIAIALGFYFIMPILFSVAYYFTSQDLVSQLTTMETGLQNYGTGVGAQQNAISPSSPLVLTVTNVQSVFSSFWESALFFPSIIIAITYVFIVQVAELIGGTAKTSARLRSFV